MVQSPKQGLGKMSGWFLFFPQEEERKWVQAPITDDNNACSLGRGILTPTWNAKQGGITRVKPAYRMLAWVKTYSESDCHVSLKGLYFKPFHLFHSRSPEVPKPEMEITWALLPSLHSPPPNITLKSLICLIGINNGSVVSSPTQATCGGVPGPHVYNDKSIGNH